MTTPEEQQRTADLHTLLLQRCSFLQEAPVRRKASARTNHDQRRLSIFRQTERCLSVAYKCIDGIALLFMCKVVGTQSSKFAMSRFCQGLHHTYSNTTCIILLQWRRRDGIVARSNRCQ